MYMPNITLSIPEDVYRKMKEYSEIKWSEVVRKAIVDYLKKLEESRTEISTKELLEELGEDLLKDLDVDKAIEGYERMRDGEWRRYSTIQAN